MPSEDNWSFIWRGVNPENILKHAEKGSFDQEIASRGGSKLIKITEDEECIYEFIPDINFSQKVPFRDVGVSELQTKAAAPGIDLLLMTVTDIERKAVLAEMDPWPGEEAILVGAISHNTYRFGQFGRYTTAQVESTMSNEGRDGARSTLQDAITELKPKAILLVGIAFGINRRKQHLGDVIIAESVFNYELQRAGEKSSILRGRETNCSPILSERFRTRRSDWHLYCSKRLVNVHQGLLLSGSKLIDSKEFRNQLVNQFQNREPLGGEMEGAGAYEVADRKGTDIILVKGICDWADGHKNNHAQPFAAYAAVSLAKHVLNKPDVLAELKAIDVIPSDNLIDPPDKGKYDHDYGAILNEFQIGNTVLFLGSGVNLCGREPIREEILDLFLLEEEKQNQLSYTQKIQLIEAKQSSLSEIELAFILDKKIREKISGRSQISTDLMQTLMGLPCQECYSDITKRPPECPIWRQLEGIQENNKQLTGEKLNCPLAIEQRLAVAKMNIRFLSQYLQSIRSPATLYATVESFYQNCKPNRLHKALANLLKKMPVLPFELVVTTNYDDLLEQAFWDAHIAFDVVSYVEADQFDKRCFICHSYDQNGNCQSKEITTTRFQYPVILKLYGWLKNKQIVITEDQHIDYLLSNPFKNLIPTHLKGIIESKSVLFLGYSWNDYDLKHILGQSDLKITSKGQTWFIYKSKPGSFLEASWGNDKKFHPIENTLDQCVDKLENFVSGK